MSVQNHLKVTVVQDATEALRHGFFYREPVFKPIRIENVVVVNKGTETGKPTVDLVLEDGNGQKYVCMITGALLKSIPLGD